MVAEEPQGPPVELPVFSGPLDLLLHLIRKHELSIYDIPIVLICDQYHAHLRAMRELDLDVAGAVVDDQYVAADAFDLDVAG